jgi:hypothetical protein
MLGIKGYENNPREMSLEGGNCIDQYLILFIHRSLIQEETSRNLFI